MSTQPIATASRIGHRRLLLGVPSLLAVGAICLVVAGWRSSSGEPASQGPVALNFTDARAHAEMACADMAVLEDIVRANGSFASASKLLDRAAAAGTQAAKEDPLWVSLASGVLAVRAGFRENDGALTRSGITTVHHECLRTIVP